MPFSTSTRQTPDFAAPGSAAGLSHSRIRSEIPDQLKWDTSHIYDSWEVWEADLASLDPLIVKLSGFKGRLAEGAETLLAGSQLAEQISKTMAKLGGYSHLNFDTDQRDNNVNAAFQKVLHVGSRISQAIAWFTPEVLALGETKVMSWIDATPGLLPYRFGYSEAFRKQQHVLDEAGEHLLSLNQRLAQAPSQAYEMLTTADIKWPEVTLGDGNRLTVSPSRYSTLLETNRNQDDRRKAFEAMMATYQASANTFASLYHSVCQRDWYYTQARKYPDCLTADLNDDLIPTALYNNLVEITKQGFEPVQRYHQLRKQYLGLETYHQYDTALALLESHRVYPYEEVQQMVIESVAPLGTDYQNRVLKAFGGRWIDVFETDGKRSGAYSAGVYGVHPYILLNYTGTLDYAFTVAHEMGHTIHTLLSQESQPFATSGYTIFVAEVASTMNEALFLDYLLRNTKDPRERALLIERSVDQILGTFYAQVRFAEFEWRVHQAVEKGESITSQNLNSRFEASFKQMYGNSVEFDPQSVIGWARIPHIFRTPFYVYQYATSFAASTSLAQQIIPQYGVPLDDTHRSEAISKYLNLLRSGGNDHPIEQLKKAGVDLTRPIAVQAVVDLLSLRVTQLEEALASI